MAFFGERTSHGKKAIFIICLYRPKFMSDFGFVFSGSVAEGMTIYFHVDR